MESRLILAYGLMLTMALIAASVVAYRFYYTRERSYRRRLRKVKRVHDERMASPDPRAAR